MSDTVYADEAAVPTPRAARAEVPARVDVLVVGGGLTGLSAALHLARAGRDVALVEAEMFGEGASGRNGGQLHPGQRRDQVWLTRRLGPALADRLWELGEEAVALVHRLRTELDAPCDFQSGMIEAAHTSAAFAAACEYADHLNARYGVSSQVLDAEALAAAIGSRRYVGGVRDGTGGHLNPLALVAALVAGAEAAGARLFPATRAIAHTEVRGGWSVRLEREGESAHCLQAEAVLLAGNGYLRNVAPEVERRIMPLVNYIAATEPLDRQLIPGGEAVSDTRAVVRYFREDAQGRMVFGGGESYGRPPADVARVVRPYLSEVYPQLAATPLVAAWAGTLAITRTRCPLIRRLAPGLYVAAGYSGQGVGIATFAGKVIADAIAGDTARLDVLSQLPVPPFPGGTRFIGPLATLAMTWFSLRDRLALPASLGGASGGGVDDTRDA